MEEQARILPKRDLFFEKDEDVFKEDRVMWADSTVFRVFTIPFLEGNPGSALSEPYSLIVSETLA